MNITNWCVRIATLGPVGYLGASGTIATILTVPAVYWISSIVSDQRLYLGMVVCMFALSMVIVTRAMRKFKRHDDPSEIVLDEVVGCLLVFWGIALSPKSVLVGFLLFRALDIIKFGLVKKAEELADAWGIMADDLVAALIANLVLRILF